MTKNILIEGCSFSTSSTLINVTIQSTYAIRVYDSIFFKANINNCNTVEYYFYGNFLYCSAVSPYCDLIINNCNVYNASFLSGTGCIYAQTVNSFSLTNCKFNWARSTSLITLSNIIVDCALNSNVFINNNTFIGNDLATSGGYAPTAITCYTPYQVDISNNIFSYIGNGVYITLANAATPKKSINIEKNILSGTLTPYSLCVISQDSNYLVQNIGIVNISNNIIKTGSAPKTLASVRSKQAISVIGIYANINCKINNNDIDMKTGFTGAISTDLESCIQFIGNGLCNINNNTINFQDTKSTRSFAAIYVSYSWLSDVYVLNSESAIISNNILRNSALITVNSSYIYVRDVGDIIITGNFLNKIGTAPEWYIRAHSRSINGPLQTVITDNILGSELANGGILYKDYSVTSLFINAYVARNKRQKYMKDINCTSFMQYGQNTDTNLHSRASVMFKTTTLILDHCGTVSEVVNMNAYQYQMMKDDLAPNGGNIDVWTTLPEGLYYTNLRAYEASLNTPEYVATTRKHQIIIPLDIPDFSKISAIKIPIYFNNTSPDDNKTIRFSVSIIAGNNVEDQNMIEYIPDPDDTWTITEDSISTNVEITRTLDSDNFINLYLNPTRNTTSSTLSAQQNCYILIALSSSADSSKFNLIFAIPYVRLTLVY